jgi:hypothetical protein
MKKSGPGKPGKPIPMRGLTIDEIRLVSDLRVMHSKVDELFQIVENLKRRHNGDEIRTYADRKILQQNIDNVDRIYLWFVKLREKGD